jgi:hypothetical protein
VSHEFVRKCVAQAAENLFVVPQPESAGDSWGYGTDKPRKAGLIMEVLRLCVEAENTASCAGIFERMKRAMSSGTLSSVCAPWDCYAELTRSLDGYLSSLPDSTAAIFLPFFRDAVACMLSASEPTNIGYKRFEGCAFVADNFRTLDIAIRRAGGLSFLGKWSVSTVYMPITLN